MPCNLAVSITKGAVDNAAVAALVDHELIQQAVAAVASDSGLTLVGSPYINSMGTISLTVAADRWTQYTIIVTKALAVTTRGESYAMSEQITDSVAQLLNALAQNKLSQIILNELAAIGGKNGTVEAVQAEDEGVVVRANLLTVTL